MRLASYFWLIVGGARPAFPAFVGRCGFDDGIDGSRPASSSRPSQSPGGRWYGPSGMSHDFGMSAARSDVLSEVLTLIRLRGELVYTARLAAPWGLRFQPGPAHFHFVETGEAWVTAFGQAPIRIDAGGLVLLPLGKGHTIASALGSLIQNIEVVVPDHCDRDHLVLRHGGDGLVSQVASGFFSFEGSPLPAVMAALPPVIHIP